MMKIGIVQREDVADVRVLSGIPYFMVQALKRHVGDVVLLSPDRSVVTRSVENTGRALNRISAILFGRRISTDHHRFLSWRLSRTISNRLQKSRCDVIFAPNASAEISSLETKIPIIYYSDLNWVDIVDYYAGTSSLYGFARAEADRIEAAALRRAKALIYPSEWAGRSAMQHYKMPQEKVHFIPDGANFDANDVPNREIAAHHPLDGQLRLLWTGVDWERKGGSIAYDCLMSLLAQGTDASLVVCGCNPPERYLHSKITVVPFLNKRDPQQRRKLSQLFLTANFFLFPTMAEAFGIVLCEASAHGLPSLVRNTGGVGGAIYDGENGYLLPPDATGKQYAERILEIVQDPAAYECLVRSSRRAYEERLNWDAWGQAVKPIFEQIVAEGRVVEPASI